MNIVTVFENSIPKGSFGEIRKKFEFFELHGAGYSIVTDSITLVPEGVFSSTSPMYGGFGKYGAWSLKSYTVILRERDKKMLEFYSSANQRNVDLTNNGTKITRFNWKISPTN